MSQQPAPRQIFVTTALPYANGAFHIGHIMEYIEADIWVRNLRMARHKVYFVGADDVHGAPIMLAAQKKGCTPEEFIAPIQAGRQQYLAGFHLSFDHWHSTHSDENVFWSQKIYRALKDANLIVKRDIEQFYDAEAKIFLPDRFIKGTCPKCGAEDQYGDACESCSAVYSPTEVKNPYSTLSGSTPILKTSEHYFFQLSNKECHQFLQQWTQDGKLQKEVANKIKEWVGSENSLSDWDISRDAPYFGIPIPDAPNKFFYVWLDAPIGYIASLNALLAQKGLSKDDVETFLRAPETEQYHFIGKDISYFHTLFWPAMLHFSGLKPPTNVFVHGFITVAGAKMSKSRGTGICPLKYLQVGLNAEWLRYYLATKLSGHVEDIEFSPEDFINRINSDLIGKYVNLASRASPFLDKHFNNTIGAVDDTILAPVRQLAATLSASYESRKYGLALREIMLQADKLNQFFDHHKPWIMAKDKAQHPLLHTVCSTVLEGFRLLSIMLKPVLPQTVERIESWLKIEPLHWEHIHTPLQGVINKYQHLMQRVTQAQLDKLFISEEKMKPQDTPKKEEVPHINIHDFAKVEMKVGQVLTCEAVEGSHKLLKFTLNVGEAQPRTVFSGIATFYPNPNELVDRKVIVVTNLAPRKMRFGTSEGMILSAAAKDDSRLFLLETDHNAEPGMIVA